MTHGQQHARLLCPPLSPRACSSSCPLSWRCYLTISSSAIPFPFAFSLSQHHSLFQWVDSSHQFWVRKFMFLSLISMNTLMTKQYILLCCCCCQVASVVSSSVWPHRWQPTRLPRPWDSPSNNTGVGCHFLLQCMKMKSESEVAQSCPTLSDPMDCSPPGSSVHGIFQARALEWVAIAFSNILLYWQGNREQLKFSPTSVQSWSPASSYISNKHTLVFLDFIICFK